MHVEPTNEFILSIACNSYLVLKCHTVLSAPISDKGPVEEVSIECDKDERLSLSNVTEELVQHRLLIWLIEYSKHSYVILRFRTVLEVCHISTDYSPIGNQEANAIEYIGYHHYLIEARVREF